MAGRRQEKNKATALPLPPPQNAPERPENSEQQITAFLAIQLNNVKLWVHLEGQASAKKVGVANAEDLDDLRPILQSKFRSLRSVEQGDIQFFVRKSHTNPLPPGTTIEEIQANNTDKVPLIVRYPLSNDTGTILFPTPIVAPVMLNSLLSFCSRYRGYAHQESYQNLSGSFHRYLVPPTS